MNSKLSLGVLLAVAVTGLAWAGLPPAQDANAKLEALEKDVLALREELSALKSKAENETAKELAKQRAEIDQLLAWGRAQARAAGALQAVLADAREKGFVAGINPDSRTVLLDGFHALAEATKSGLPEEPAPPAPAKKQLPARRAPTPAKH
ncbi:MAG: hypothetical protein IT454_21565 [Planctomycetes bacterium]|nr:hypothetical protein [Planctomycetota bacterium]